MGVKQADGVVAADVLEDLRQQEHRLARARRPPDQAVLSLVAAGEHQRPTRLGKTRP